MVPSYSSVAICTDKKYAISFRYNEDLYLLFLPSCEVQRVRDNNQVQIPLLLYYHYITTIRISSS